MPVALNITQRVVSIKAPPPYADPRFVETLREPDGTVKLGSSFYIERIADQQLSWELRKLHGTTTTIRASRQTGKSSLLIRGVAEAQTQGRKAVLIILQPIEERYLQSLDAFLHYIITVIVTKLRLDPSEVVRAWQGPLGATDKATYLMEDYVLPQVETSILLAIDEADRLLQTPFHDTFFGLLRFWHNSRALNELWDKLDLVLVISTEPHFLISDFTQSPFNVGLKIRLEDFDVTQVQELNRRYRSPLNEQDLPALMDFLNGHPYLTSRALYTLVTAGMPWETLLQTAHERSSPFNDHLRRYLWMLQDQPQLRKALKQIIKRGDCPDEFIYYRLIQAGLIKGSSSKACQCRCRLYEDYLKNQI